MSKTESRKRNRELVTVVIDQIQNSKLNRDEIQSIIDTCNGLLNTMPLTISNVPAEFECKVAGFYCNKIVWKNGEETSFLMEKESHLETRIEVGPFIMCISTDEADPPAFCDFDELCEELRPHGFNKKHDVEEFVEYLLTSVYPNEYALEMFYRDFQNYYEEW
jgi:hypothetical protein